MKKRILIVGGVAGGASTATRIRRLDENAEIIIFEKGPHVSFSNCSLPYYLSGIVENSDDLLLMNPDIFKKRYKIEARVNHEVTRINPKEKTIQIQDLITKEEYKEEYDKLVLSPGANPILPNIEGVSNKNVFTVRNVMDITKLKDYINKDSIKEVAVIGGGFIGLEVAENLKLAGHTVTLVEAANQVMPPFDYDMAQIIHKDLVDHGINLILEDGIKGIYEKEIQLESGKSIPCQAVIMAIGVRPDIKLAKEAGLLIGERGGIKVNQHYLTSDNNIYAIGDAIEVYHSITHKSTRLALAGPARKQARDVANHINNMEVKNPGVIGSSVVKYFNINAATTGINEKTAKLEGFEYNTVYIIPNDMVGLMPESNPMHFKLIYEEPSGRILGAQAIGKGNVDKRIDVIASLIMMKATIEDLKDVEVCYAPPFSNPIDVINQAALVGLNLLNGRYKQVTTPQVRELVEKDAFILDVREKEEYDMGHLINGKNIPLSQLRGRIGEIPKDVPVYVHCRSGQRSYNAVMLLQNLGYENVYNIAGSFLGICLYEYYNDTISKREKIVTEYNFN